MAYTPLASRSSRLPLASSVVITTIVVAVLSLALRVQQELPAVAIANGKLAASSPIVGATGGGYWQSRLDVALLRAEEQASADSDDGADSSWSPPRAEEASPRHARSHALVASVGCKQFDTGLWGNGVLELFQIAGGLPGCSLRRFASSLSLLSCRYRGARIGDADVGFKPRAGPPATEYRALLCCNVFGSNCDV